MESYRTGPETTRLILRAMTIDDAAAFYALNSHPDVMRLTGEPPLASVEAAREAIATYPDFDTVGYGRWGCVLKETGAMIGFCGLKYLADLEEVDLGYRLLPEYWGRGLATEASLASVAFGFDTLKLTRIIGLVLPENIGSIRVLEKVGMREAGEVAYDGQRALRYVVER
ncbi:MAG TPA: GNAT family N-acetyltransferase [Phycisphaerae bacterium]|nr:GNAT family N-acetyltransferase [Phycisphaerae bacterium]HRW56051.1 GNAT family N-acetyltransferase [Phycisphaerae bacterium]